MKPQLFRLAYLLPLLPLAPLVATAAAGSKEIAAEAKTFLEMYNRTYQRLYTVASEAQEAWWPPTFRPSRLGRRWLA